MTEPEAPSKPPLVLDWQDYMPAVRQDGIPQHVLEQRARDMAAEAARQRLQQAQEQQPQGPQVTAGDVDRLFATALGNNRTVEQAADILIVWAERQTHERKVLDHAIRALLVAELTRIISKTKQKK